MEIELTFEIPSIDLVFEEVEDLEFETPSMEVSFENEIDLTIETPTIEADFAPETFQVEFPVVEFDLNFHGGNTTVTYDGAGNGDMLKSVYDPTTVESDSFLLNNHTGALETSNITIDGGLLG